MKIVIFTDNHWSQYSSIVRSRTDRYSTRLENQIESINYVERYAEEIKADLIVCNGDFFDKPELNAEELSALTEVQWSTVIPHKFIVGNHEMASSDLSINSMNALAKIGEVISKPTLQCGFGYELIYLPYILETNRKSLRDYISDLYQEYYTGMFTTQEVKKRIILSHNDISGIRYGQFESKIGFNIKEITDSCDLYINGHLHNQEQINEKILNLGNLTGQNFSEDAEKYSHCFAVLDTESLNIDLIINPYAFNFYKFMIEDESEIAKQINKCKVNSIVAIKTKQSLVAKVRDAFTANKNVLEFRITTIPELDNSTNNIEELVNVDHIEQFKQYIWSQLGNNDIINSELNLL